MRAGPALIALACASAAGVAACVVSLADVVDAGDASTDVSVNETGIDSSSDGGGDVNALPDVIVPACDGGCGAPAGFAPILFALDQNTSCPLGMTQLNAPADPTVGGACACDCKVTQPPSCVPQMLTHDVGTTDAGVCATTGSAWPAFDGGCTTLSAPYSFSPWWAIPPVPAASSGACTGAPANNVAATSSTPSRLCVDPTCASACKATKGFQTCFVASGQVSCPSPLAEHHVGNVSVVCGACSACSVGLDGGCQGSLSVYAAPTCVQLLATVPFDGGCMPTGSKLNDQYFSLKYNPLDVGVVCTSGTSSGTVTLQQEVTVCCP